MSRRFIPPAVAAFGDGPDADLARTVGRAREEGFAEGRDFGLREGHAAGRDEGEAAAREQHLVELAALQERFAERQSVLAVTDALEQVVSARAADLQAIDDAARTVSAIALRTIFPTLLEHLAGKEITALLAEALTERAPETLTLRANPATLQAVAETGFPGEHGARLSMQPDPTLGLGTAEIGWAGGGLTFDPAALHARVAAILSPSNHAEKESTA
jgi:flagellar biosynthesis/type III secretory pathway protein FliH